MEDLAKMKAKSGNFESLFSRRARKYQSMGLADQKLSEEDIKGLLLSDYTFLKRPVVLFDELIFIGNSKANIAELNKAINEQ